MNVLNLPSHKPSYATKKYEHAHKQTPEDCKYRIVRNGTNYDIHKSLKDKNVVHTLRPNTRSGCSGSNCKVNLVKSLRAMLENIDLLNICS